MRINFILNSVNDAHSLKRVSDFRKKGLEVNVYGFLRNDETCVDSNTMVLGVFSNTLSYRKRVKIYYRGIKKLFSQHKDNGDLWFYLGLDVAIFAVLADHHRKFIYEECDLVHTYTCNKKAQSVMEGIDKFIIKKAHRTIITSEGFLDFHYGKKAFPDNIIIVPNKLSNDITRFGTTCKAVHDPSHLRFAFVGGVRYQSLLSIADKIGKNFPYHEFHFYGFISPTLLEKELPQRENIIYHGRYKSPEQLPEIYSNIDVLICTYDTQNENVRYAEPNKLYEAIYFSCPIIVSSNTFLAKQVDRLGIGYNVNAFDEDEIKNLVKRIEREIIDKYTSMKQLDKSIAIDNNSYINNIIH